MTTIDTTDEPDAAMIDAAAGLWAEAEAARVGAAVTSRYVEEQRRGFVDNMARADAWLTVALEGGTVVGAVGGFISPGEEATNAIGVGYVVVAERRRGQGIGRVIMACAVLRARALGAAALVLTVHETNTRARQVYEAAGWVPTGRTEITPDRHEVLLEYERRSADPSWSPSAWMSVGAPHGDRTPRPRSASKDAGASERERLAVQWLRGLGEDVLEHGACRGCQINAAQALDDLGLLDEILTRNNVEDPRPGPGRS